MDTSFLIFQIIVLVFSVVIHEVSHGLVAHAFGDPTAKDLGRLTLNPIPHIDPLGSVILPGLLILMQAGFVIGWAKPVPYNPLNLRGSRWAEPLVAFAGAGSNFIIAILFSIVVRITPISGAMLEMMHLIIILNLMLGVFNLIPIPPLDGSKILFAFLPYQFNNLRATLEQYGFILLLFFVWIGAPFVGVIVSLLYRLLV